MSDSGLLPVVEIRPANDAPATAAVGSGGTPDDYPFEIAHYMRQDPELAHIKWILPAARVSFLFLPESGPLTYRVHVDFYRPKRAITGNGGLQMPAWFDIFTFKLPITPPPAGEEDDKGILESIDALEKLLDGVIASGIPPDRIVLGGISQGGAMALLTGLTTKNKRLAGLVALSARLPLRYRLKSMVSPHASTIPIFWGHGDADRLVTLQLGRACADFLVKEIGIPPEPNWPSSGSGSGGTPSGLDFQTYQDLGHTISDEELLDVGQWLKRIVPGDAEMDSDAS
ncbi:Delta-sterol C-methyltransferase [Mycena chlorophos]|uniref:Acyl-protein thioesterase 1 n=1 Tax=Mycena chlorophos TaxID=658473 RepID=A0A8H6WJ53_MYCCL|nr:Delta-sterol C-methyltransferase [Mycena chlorophos]